MPELPEVENIVRGLQDLLGKTIREVRILSSQILRSPTHFSSAKLSQKRLLAITRKGKHILFHVEDSLKLIVHLGMTGQILRDFLQEMDLPDKHTHMIVDFGREKLYYRDVRKFGFVDCVLLDDASLDRYFKNIGQDPLEVEKGSLVSLLKKRRTRIKPLLLSQNPVAGLGNIYTDETLFEAGIHPKRKASRLSEQRLLRLCDAMRFVLQEAIQKGGSSIDDYVRPDGSKGSFQLSHQVYGREGQPCLKCGSLIKKIKLCGRGTSFCPHCQR